MTLVCSVAAALLGVTTTTAFADGSAALDDGKAAPPAPGDAAAPAAGEKPVEYGVGLRIRNVRIPKGEIELFLERAGDDGSSTLGLGVEFIRRRGNVELQLGLEYERLKPGSGIWIESGNNIANNDPADYVLPDGEQNSPLGWFTIEFTFLNHAPINKYVSVRYGGGAGLGIVLGDLEHFNMVCAGTGATNEAPQNCEPVRFGGQGQFEEGTETRVKYNLPPVFPVVNAIIGLQIKPTDKMTINIEGGIRTFLFFGTSAAYFF
ncbi:MAG: hypothetical protein H0V17_23760 [Deltaproteobacteria bacterium]|nr:hypothetical protein [Deltaproteobacteria bacterium]